MIKNYIFSIGVMSGTSLDGVDLVYVKFDEHNYQNFEILQSQTITYPLEWKDNLQSAIHKSKKELNDLDLKYGRFLGQIILNFKTEFKISEVDFIASHGHTILHQPKNGITLQIGNGNEIAKITNNKVVYNFRIQDVALGGQGAPLVPIGDELLFGAYDFCLNLGGFSNISFKHNKHRIAFDICPVNIVLNYYTSKLGLNYDDKGDIAAQGKLNTDLLHKLNQLHFYSLQPPKSLGLEWVQEFIFPLIDSYKLEINSILKTFVEHIAIQISKVVANNDNVLVTGGGTFNLYLMQRIQKHSKNKLRLPSIELINFKEALIFAFLGLLRLKGQINCLKSVTGASKNHSSGLIVNP